MSKRDSHPALVPIGASDRPGFFQSQNEISAAALRAKAGALLCSTVMLRGQIDRCVEIFAEMDGIHPEDLLPVFHPSPAILTPPRVAERPTRREHLMFLARLYGYPDVQVAKEFDQWEVANKANGLHYNDAPIGFLEQILLQRRRMVLDVNQAGPIAAVLNAHGFDLTEKFSGLRIDLEHLSWKDILELRQEPSLKRFQEFIARRLPGAPSRERVIEEWDAAQTSVNKLVKPSASGKLIPRILAQIATGPIPNPYSILRDVYGYQKERSAARDGGHVYFVLDARERADRNRAGTGSRDGEAGWTQVIDEILG